MQKQNNEITMNCQLLLVHMMHSWSCLIECLKNFITYALCKSWYPIICIVCSVYDVPI